MAWLIFRSKYRQDTNLFNGSGSKLEKREMEELQLLIDLHKGANRQGTGGDEETEKVINQAAIAEECVVWGRNNIPIKISLNTIHKSLFLWFRSSFLPPESSL